MQSTEKAKEDVKRALKVLDDHLLTRTYLVGERITLADISLCCNLLSLYQMVRIFGKKKLLRQCHLSLGKFIIAFTGYVLQ